MDSVAAPKRWRELSSSPSMEPNKRIDTNGTQATSTNNVAARKQRQEWSSSPPTRSHRKKRETRQDSVAAPKRRLDVLSGLVASSVIFAWCLRSIHMFSPMSNQSLQVDYGQVTATLLIELIDVQRAAANGSLVNGIPRRARTSPFVPRHRTQHRPRWERGVYFEGLWIRDRLEQRLFSHNGDSGAQLWWRLPLSAAKRHVQPEGDRFDTHLLVAVDEKRGTVGTVDPRSFRAVTYTNDVSALKTYRMFTLPLHIQAAIATIAQYLSTVDTRRGSVSVSFVSDPDNINLPSETVAEIPEPTGSPGSEAGGSLLEAIPALGAGVQPASSGVARSRQWTFARLEVPSASSFAGRQSGPVDIDEGLNSQTNVASDDLEDMDFFATVSRSLWGVTLPEVTLSAFTETGQAESFIKGVLDRLNATLGTSHTLARPSLLSLLEDCIEKKYDFGMAYARLRPVWYIKDDRTMKEELCKRENEDVERRRKALVGNRIVDPSLPHRRVWDLFSNRVVPYWIAKGVGPQPISHAWVDDEDREDVWTAINGKEWPVPIPKDVDLRLLRIELVNLGVEYAWLDVLCLRQKGGLREDLRAEEWKQDVPTIGRAYIASSIPVVIYLSGLGRPLSLKEGDLDSDRCWFRRAWTLQEVGFERIIAGDTPDGPMHAKEIDDDEAGVNRLAFRLRSMSIPAYYESVSLEDAWTAEMRAYFLFVYPGVGLVCKKWRPSWEQIMTQSLPADVDCFGSVKHVDETNEDWFEGPCIEKGLVRGLDAGSAEGDDRYGELVVDAADGSTHTFKIYANHNSPIPEDTYTLLGSKPVNICNFPIPQYWAVGQRLGEKFEKVSVFVMDREQAERLGRLGLMLDSRNPDDEEFSEECKECDTPTIGQSSVHAASVAKNLSWPVNIRAEAAVILLVVWTSWRMGWLDFKGKVVGI
ncbi:hypothetical protein IW262DRAFT_1298520 [Armillaria fumosa]|nr:hypothetical protein IW262DRAFT_1298520 [Armillaria fumosa]